MLRACWMRLSSYLVSPGIVFWCHNMLLPKTVKITIRFISHFGWIYHIDGSCWGSIVGSPVSPIEGRYFHWRLINLIILFLIGVTCLLVHHESCRLNCVVVAFMLRYISADQYIDVDWWLYTISKVFVLFVSRVSTVVVSVTVGTQNDSWTYIWISVVIS